MEFSRRRFVVFLAALSGGAITNGIAPERAAATPSSIPTPAPIAPSSLLTTPGAELRETRSGMTFEACNPTDTPQCASPWCATFARARTD